MNISDLANILSILIQLILLEGILSIDNAAVLGAMVSTLPTDQPVPYPPSLGFLQGLTNGLLGMQQSAALKVGLLGAYLGQGTMLIIAAWVISHPALKILGAAYLIKLAFNQLEAPDQPGEVEIMAQHRKAKSFWLVVLNVELADLAFSLDNVVAAVSISDKLWVVMLGVALSIILMRFAAGIFAWLISREPVLATAAYIVVFNIGLELLLDRVWSISLGNGQKFFISLATLAVCLLYSRVKWLQFFNPVLNWLAQGIGNVNELVDWALRPAIFLVRWLFGLGQVGYQLLKQGPG